jgi:hypothetical protein
MALATAVALDQICRVGAKYETGCINFQENSKVGHPNVGATELKISKFLQNPPSSCAAQQPRALKQLE